MAEQATGTTRTPAVSVFMPVHNEADWVDAAIASIVGQTFRDLELVIVDDGSSDGTASILDRWANSDNRIKVQANATPIGLARSSNQAVELCRAPVVARMDGDDISESERIQRQMEILESDPRTVLVGTLFVGIDAGGRQIKSRDRGRLMRPGPFSPFPHGSVMFKRDPFDEVGGYRAVAEGCEDLDLFLRLARLGKVQVAMEALYRYRYHVGNTALTVPRVERIEILRERETAISRSAAAASSNRKLAAEAYMSISAMSVWAGHRPYRKVGLSLDAFWGSPGQVARSVLYNSWGNLHPRSLRATFAHGIRWRDRIAGKALGPARATEWRFGS